MTRSQVNNNELAERCEYNSGLLIYGYLSAELSRYYTRDTNREITGLPSRAASLGNNI